MKLEVARRFERLEKDVRELEIRSWDREDAVEDLGTKGP